MLRFYYILIGVLILCSGQLLGQAQADFHRNCNHGVLEKANAADPLDLWIERLPFFVIDGNVEQFAFKIYATHESNEVESVTVQLRNYCESHSLIDLELNDDGIGMDESAKDNIYTSSIDICTSLAVAVEEDYRRIERSIPIEIKYTNGETKLLRHTVSTFHVTSDYYQELEQQSDAHKIVESVEQTSNGGLSFDLSRYRGTEYTDSEGANYNVRYRPITITNDSTVSIKIQFDFLKEYVYKDEKFRIFPLSEEWGANDGNWDVMWKEFPNYLSNPFLEKTIEPGESVVMAIGELLKRPIQFSINLEALHAHNKSSSFPNCENLIGDRPRRNSEITLGLKLNFTESCTIIPCGKIIYD